MSALQSIALINVQRDGLSFQHILAIVSLASHTALTTVLRKRSLFLRNAVEYVFSINSTYLNMCLFNTMALSTVRVLLRAIHHRLRLWAIPDCHMNEHDVCISATVCMRKRGSCPHMARIAAAIDRVRTDAVGPGQRFAIASTEVCSRSLSRDNNVTIR